MIHILYERLGGHHMDVGASALVIDGQVCHPGSRLLHGVVGF